MEILSVSDGYCFGNFAEGIHRFAAKSVDKNKWRLTKQKKRTGNLVDLLENQMPKALLQTKLYGRAQLPWPNHILLF